MVEQDWVGPTRAGPLRSSRLFVHPLVGSHVPAARHRLPSLSAPTGMRRVHRTCSCGVFPELPASPERIRPASISPLPFWGSFLFSSPFPPLLMTTDRNTVTGVFNSPEHADSAYRSLRDRGYADNDIHVVMSDDTREEVLHPRRRRDRARLEGDGRGRYWRCHRRHRWRHPRERSPLRVPLSPCPASASPSRAPSPEPSRALVPVALLVASSARSSVRHPGRPGQDLPGQHQRRRHRRRCAYEERRRLGLLHGRVRQVRRPAGSHVLETPSRCRRVSR